MTKIRDGAWVAEVRTWAGARSLAKGFETLRAAFN